jgi:hypothetical protein
MTNRERLLGAIRLLEGAAGDLDTAGHTCDACGLQVRANWPEHQADVTLRGVVNKLERLVEAPNLQRWLDAASPEPGGASVAG